jgi:hypothetical protein
MLPEDPPLIGALTYLFTDRLVCGPRNKPAIRSLEHRSACAAPSQWRRKIVSTEVSPCKTPRDQTLEQCGHPSIMPMTVSWQFLATRFEAFSRRTMGRTDGVAIRAIQATGLCAKVHREAEAKRRDSSQPHAR